jgi:hypothetical protein
MKRAYDSFLSQEVDLRRCELFVGVALRRVNSKTRERGTRASLTLANSGQSCLNQAHK